MIKYMRPDERQKQISELLALSDTPISGSQLARKFSVSRQIIIRDIDTIRKGGVNIISTHTGYILQKPPSVKKVIKVRHTDAEIEKELNAIVDIGGRVLDVFVKHRAYDEVRVPLKICSRRDAALFAQSIRSGKSASLANITSGYHYHTIEAENEEIMDLIEKELGKMNMLAEFLDYEV